MQIIDHNLPYNINMVSSISIEFNIFVFTFIHQNTFCLIKITHASPRWEKSGPNISETAGLIEKNALNDLNNFVSSRFWHYNKWQKIKRKPCTSWKRIKLRGCQQVYNSFRIGTRTCFSLWYCRQCNVLLWHVLSYSPS